MWSFCSFTVSSLRDLRFFPRFGSWRSMDVFDSVRWRSSLSLCPRSRRSEGQGGSKVRWQRLALQKIDQEISPFGGEKVRLDELFHYMSCNVATGPRKQPTCWEHPESGDASIKTCPGLLRLWCLWQWVCRCCLRCQQHIHWILRRNLANDGPIEIAMKYHESHQQSTCFRTRITLLVCYSGRPFSDLSELAVSSLQSFQSDPPSRISSVQNPPGWCWLIYCLIYDAAIFQCFTIFILLNRTTSPGWRHGMPGLMDLSFRKLSSHAGAGWSVVECRVWSEHTLGNQTFLSEKLSLPIFLSLKVPQHSSDSVFPAKARFTPGVGGSGSLPCLSTRISAKQKRGTSPFRGSCRDAMLSGRIACSAYVVHM